MRKFVEKDSKFWTFVGIYNLRKIREEGQIFYLINAWRSDVGKGG